jgi:hypothetical protein
MFTTLRIPRPTVPLWTLLLPPLFATLLILATATSPRPLPPNDIAATATVQTRILNDLFSPPTKTLRPTRTPKPTRTPRPTKTSTHTRTPRPTHTTRPTRTPKLTPTLRPTKIPKLTRTPRPTGTPTPHCHELTPTTTPTTTQP